MNATRYRFALGILCFLLCVAPAFRDAWAQDPEPTKAPPAAAKPPPPPAATGPIQEKLGRCEIANWRAIIDLWKTSATGQTDDLLRVYEARQLELTEEGDCEFPSFSPDGKKLAITISNDKGGRRASALRVMSPERLEQARPRLLEVQSRTQMGIPIIGLSRRVEFRSHDSQVYFAWVSAVEFVYYSRVHEKIFRGRYNALKRRATADVVASQLAITLPGWGNAVYYQDLRGIAHASSSAMSSGIVKIGRSRVDGKPIDLATMPAVCPTNPSIVAFIGRLRESSSTDLCVRFGDGTIVRAHTQDGWEKLPAWSPDGRHIAFYSTKTNPRSNEYGVWAVRVSPFSRRLGAIFNVSGDDQISPHDLRDARRTGGPAWTPNSKQVLYFAKSRRGTTEQEDYYLLKSFDIRYGEDEGTLPAAMPKGLKLNSPGDISSCPAGGLIAFSNAVTTGRHRDYRVVILRTNLPGRVIR